MLRWNGSTWTEFDYDPEQLWLCGLSFVLAISPTNAWGLGQNCNANGTLIHWDGASWNKAGYAYGVLVAFDVVPGSGGNQGWAAGRGGRLARWDGSQLTPVPDNNTVALNSVEMLAPNDGWVVGYNANSDAPTLHWDGTNWSEMGKEWLSDTSFISAQNGWAVGPFRNIIHWDGSNWTEITRMQHALNAIDMVSATDGWAVGGGSYVGCEQSQENCSLIVYWNGSTWSTVANPSPYGLLGISMLSASDGWAVGGSQFYCPAETNCSIISRWNGTQWSRLDSPTTKSLYAIAMNSATDGWAVGANGAILKWNGVAWLVFSSPVTSHLYSIAMFSATDGWIVGAQGTILHWNGTTWTKIDSPVTSSLLGVAYASETEVWAVGSNGVIIRYVAPSAGLAINYPTGAPGSYFTIMGSNFPPNSTANITFNENGLGIVPTDSSGGLTFLLETCQADEGDYIVTASVNPAASVSFVLGSSQPMRPQEGTGPIFNLPAGIAYTHGIYLPLIRK
jgi:hypothetical protein